MLIVSSLRQGDRLGGLPGHLHRGEQHHVTETVATPLIDRLERSRAAVTLEDRILDATRRCVARWGVAKTTLDDIAREAGCSRATVYRVFPGGKDSVLVAAWTNEIASFCAALRRELVEAESLEDIVVVAITESCRAIAQHDALQYLLQHEPGAVLPYVAFDGLDPLLGWAADYAEPLLARFLDPRPARDLGEWVARVIVSYGFEPTDELDLTDSAVARRFVKTYVLPGVLVRSDAHNPDASTQEQ
jgi:AcrR family transcriptional regulator